MSDSYLPETLSWPLEASEYLLRGAGKAAGWPNDLEAQQRMEEARIWLDNSRHQIFPPLKCKVCGSFAGTLIARDDDPDLEMKIARESERALCWMHSEDNP